MHVGNGIMTEQQQWQALGEWMVGDGPDPRLEGTEMDFDDAMQTLLQSLPDHWEVCITIKGKTTLVQLFDEESRLLYSEDTDGNRTFAGILQECINCLEDARP
jgi:hypothetical protein